MAAFSAALNRPQFADARARWSCDAMQMATSIVSEATTPPSPPIEKTASVIDERRPLEKSDAALSSKYDAIFAVRDGANLDCVSVCGRVAQKKQPHFADRANFARKNIAFAFVGKRRRRSERYV